MEMRAWKKVVLQWVTECHFGERNYFNIEQSNIDEFFYNFCKHHNKASSPRSKGKGSPGSQSLSLISFLQEYYPDLSCHLDDENELSAGDYVYAYTLLLHFSCVKYPESYFHGICQRLSEHAQQCIASFFKQLLECDVINKQNVRHAIAIVTQNHLSPAQGDSLNNSTPSSNSPTSTRFASPLRTPRRQTTINSPSSTPKSYLLEERTRELYNLRAQLDTERYEKGLLELQIKQNDDKISKLNRDQKRLQQQVQDLKNELLTQSTERLSPSRGSEEQIQRRLCKEISLKEIEISKLTDMLSTFKEEKTFVEGKLTFSEKQIISCMSRIKELEFKLDELSADLEDKSCTIKFLTDSKKELEHFISETRSASKRQDLNSTEDSIDSSFLQTNSTGSADSPENLGCSVVDKQLREKEIENAHLRKEMCLIQECNSRLASHIRQLTSKYTDEFNIDINVCLTEAEGSDLNPAESFLLFANCMENLSNYYREECTRVEKLQEEGKVMQMKNEIFEKKIENFERDVKELKENLKNVENLNKELNQNKIDLQEKLKRSDVELDVLNKQKYELVTNLEIMANDFDTYKNGSEDKLNKMDQRIANLVLEIEQRDKDNAELKSKNEDLKSLADNLQEKLDEVKGKFHNKTAEYESTIKSLNDLLLNNKKNMEASQTTEQVVKEKYEKLLIQTESLKRDKRESDKHLEKMRNEIAVKEMEMGKIGIEIVEVRQKNVDLELSINKVMEEYKADKQSSGLEINNRDKCIKEIDSDRSKLKSSLDSLQLELDMIKRDCKKSEEELKLLAQKTHSICNLLELPLPASQDKVPKSLNDVMTKVKDLLDFKKETTEKIETLECADNENKSHIKKLEEELKKTMEEKQDLILEGEKNMSKLKEELEFNEEKISTYERQLYALNMAQHSLTERMKQELEFKERELEEYRKKSSQHALTLMNFEEELKSEKETVGNKERELMLLITEYADVRGKLAQTQEEAESLQKHKAELESKYLHKINELERKLDECNVENQQLMKVVKNYKQESSKSEKRLKEADEALIRLYDQLSEENKFKDNLEVELKVSKERLTETATKLEKFIQTASDCENHCAKLKEAESAIINLEQSKAEQSVQLEEARNLIATFEQLKTEKNKSIAELQKSLSESNAEKHRAELVVTDLEQSVKQHKQEKEEVLAVLNKTKAELKTAEDIEKKASLFEKQYKELSILVEQTNDQTIKLKTELLTKEAELSICREEQQKEKLDFEQKTQELMQKISSQNVELQTIDVMHLEMLATLENIHINMAIENSRVENLFNVEDQNKDNKLNKMKSVLNELICNVKQHRAENATIERKQKEAQNQITSLNMLNESLNKKLSKNQVEILRLQENEKKYVDINNKLESRLSRLTASMFNLEKSNGLLTEQNHELQAKLKSLEEEVVATKANINQLKEDNKNLQLDSKINLEALNRLKQEEKTCADLLKEKEAAMYELLEKNLLLEKTIKNKTTKLNVSENELKIQTEKHKKNEMYTKEVETKLVQVEQEIVVISQQLKQQEIQHKNLNSELSEKNKEFVSLQAAQNDLNENYKRLEQKYNDQSQKFDEAQAKLIGTEEKLVELKSAYDEAIREKALIQSQQEITSEDIERQAKEVEELNKDKLNLNKEIKNIKRELQQANDNVTQLIQQVCSIRLEKEAIVDESQLLHKQLEELSQLKSASQTELNAVIERSQLLERQLLNSENEIKAIRATLQENELNAKKMITDNQKLRELHETSTKQVEKYALKLGESQARCLKLERDNEKFAKTVEANSAAVETLQREKETLHVDAKLLKDRLLKAERTLDQFTTTIYTLEQSNSSLHTTKQNLETLALENKSKISKLEKIKETNEEKIRKLNNDLSNSEQMNVRLNLDIGALNSQIAEEKNVANAERLEQIEELTSSLKEAKEKAQNLNEMNEKLRQEVEQLREENINTSDKLCKMSLSLQISKDKCEDLLKEMEELRADMFCLKEAKDKLEEQHVYNCDKLREYTEMNAALTAEKESLVQQFEKKINKLELELEAKIAKVVMLESDIDELKTSIESNVVDIKPKSLEVDQLRLRLTVLETEMEKEKNISTQLRLDNQILQAKYREAKQRALDEAKASEDRIKEHRLELEGKLEKMKNKMKTLYTEEISKMKTKQEREKACIKIEMDELKIQNSKYEEHTRKLSSQIVRLNDRILEQQKQNTIVSTKLKHLEEESCKNFKRPISMHATPMSSTTNCAPTNIGTNLAMEDEEGEIFNNTYLTDLKNGRMSELMNRDICAEELQYRNSLLPPHLKSTYAAQYDHGLGEDELKDGAQSLDDSMIGLLSTTAGGTRKKMSGVTHYKRPGPPTPSKNGGRLSFGANSEPPREILKESYEGNSAKTPARFGFFSSKFSMGNPKDEPKSLNPNACKAVKKKNLQIRRMVKANFICTSTPRKSKTHYDQRRLLDFMSLKSESSASPGSKIFDADNDPEDISDASFTVSTTKFPLHRQLLRRGNECRRRHCVRSRRSSYRHKDVLLPEHNGKDIPTSDTINTPLEAVEDYTSGSTGSSNCLASLQCLKHRRAKRVKGARPSLNLCGNIFSRVRTPNRGILREIKRNKARRERNENFYRFRLQQQEKQRNLEKISVQGNATYDLDKPTVLAETYLKNTLMLDDDNNTSSNYIKHEINDFTYDIDNEYDRMEYVADEDNDFMELVDKRLEFADVCAEQNIEDSTVGDLKQFEKLLKATESSAPFEVQKVKFDESSMCKVADFITSQNSSNSSMRSSESTAVAPYNGTTIMHANSMAKPFLCNTTQSIVGNNLSRVIYASNIIYHRRLPEINTTYVRKSSIYIRNEGSNDDVILLTNQTITIVDIAKMWMQMNRTTRVIVGFAATASILCILVVLYVVFFS